MELEEDILSDKINLAVLQFKAKNYRQCVAIYSELVLKLSALSEGEVIRIRKFHQLSSKPAFGKLVHPKLCNILDHRAASYEKLACLDLARQDAKKIINSDPVNCKGYLRLGKLYLMGNDKISAYKVYQQGVFLIQKAVEKKNVAVPERLWKQLQSQYKDVNRALKAERRSESSTPKAKKSELSATNLKAKPFEANSAADSAPGLQRHFDRMLPLKRIIRDSEHQATSVKRPKWNRDIFEIFSRDIIEAVFALLPFHDILRGLLVCKLWYGTLTSLPTLFKHRFTLKHRITLPEYFQGLKLMKKVVSHLFSQSIHLLSLWSTFNMLHLGKILESIISDDSLKLTRLHVLDKHFSMELLFQKLEKINWRFSSLTSVQHLRFGINSSLYDGGVIFRIFPSLESLELLSIDHVLRKTNMLMIPSFSNGYHQLILEGKNTHTHSNLRKLLLVNHPNLKRDQQLVRPGEKTFDPRPPFLNISFPALTELRITSFDFTGLAVEFQAFLREASSLTELYLENNEELSLKKFLLLVSLCSPKFSLEKLTLRESHQEGSYGIDEITADDLISISSLTHLDIYGSSISGTGFLKLLAMINNDNTLRSINVGHLSYVQFKNDNFAAAHSVLRFSQLFELVPRLTYLKIPELNIDNLSMRLLREDLTKFYLESGQQVPLMYLDLSFCPLIDGIGLMNLFRSTGNASDNGHFTLDTFVLDGLYFKPETIQLLQKRAYVKNFQNDPHKKKWRTYGVNSLVIETD